MDRITWHLLAQQLSNNPLPWKVDIDWTVEVRASNGVIIAKCQTVGGAEDIIGAAEEVQKKLDSAGKFSIETSLA